MKGLHYISFALVVIGGLNWGLVGLAGLVGGAANWNLVNLIFGSMPLLENVVYLVVGLAAISLALSHKKDCRNCAVSGAM